jgi:hypothetical protein
LYNFVHCLIMKNYLLFVMLFFLSAAGAQETTIPVRFVSNSKEAPGQYIGKDTFEWQYTITNNTLRKQKDNGYVEYKNVSLGDIEKVDILNPLQVLLFYKKFNTVVLLDNQLNEVSRINFSDMQEPVIAEATGVAGQNQIWLFDLNSLQLGLFNPSEKEFKAVTPPFSEQIIFYQSDYNYFYWIDATGRFYASNLFGKVNFLGNVPNFEQAQILSQNTILLKKDNNLYIYDLGKGSSTSIEIVEKSFRSFHYAAQILSIFTDNEINQYKVILPE